MAFRLVAPATALLLVTAGSRAGAQTTPADDTSNKATLPPAAASAPTAPATTSPFTTTGSAAIVSQYRFRGSPQSDNKPVVQGTFTVSPSSHLGHTGGAFDYAGHDYLNYTVGAGYEWKVLTFDVSLVGSNISHSDTRAADLAMGSNDFHRAAKRVVVGSVSAIL